MTYIKNFKGQTKEDCEEDASEYFGLYDTYFVYLYGYGSILYYRIPGPK